MVDPVTSPDERSWIVKLAEMPGQWRAWIEGDFADGPWEFAFYLMEGRSRRAVHWYSPAVSVEFPRTAESGKFHGVGFVRRPGSKDGAMRSSVPVELGLTTGGSPRLDGEGPPYEPFVLVKSYYGLGGDLCVLLGALKLAESQGRHLVVDWSSGFYGEADTGSLFHSLFDAPRFETMEHLRGQRFSVFPPCWVGRTDLRPVSYVKDVPLTLSRPDDVPESCDAECVVITRDSRRMLTAPQEYFEVASRLRPAARILDIIDHQTAALRLSSHSIGIHYRHGNGEHTVIPPDPKWFLARIEERIANLGLSADKVSVFVATDCEAALDYFRSHFPLTVDLGKKYRPNGAGPLHRRDDVTATEKPELAEEALVDMYVLSRCDSFVGSLGYFSLFVRLLRAGGHGVVYDGARVFTDAQIPSTWRSIAKDAQLGPMLAGKGMALDGLFSEVVGGVTRIHYYDTPLMDIHSPNSLVDAEQIDALAEAVAARRLY